MLKRTERIVVDELVGRTNRYLIVYLVLHIGMTQPNHVYCSSCENKINRELAEKEDSSWDYDEGSREWTCPTCQEYR